MRFAGQVFISKDPTIWLDGAEHANTYIPPSIPRNAPVKLHGIHRHQKYIYKYLKIAKLVEITFLFKKNQRKSLTKSLLATVSLSNTTFIIITSPMNSVSTYIITLTYCLILKHPLETRTRRTNQDCLVYSSKTV